MGETTAADPRCPRCAATLRPGAPWCTQCYAPAGTAAASPVPGQRAAPTAGVRVDGPVAPAATAATGLPTTTWPCSACGRSNALALAACRACGTTFLADARDAPPALVLPVVGDLGALSPVRRVGLAAGTVVAFVLITSLLALLLA